MPTPRHEALHRIAQEDPTTIPWLLRNAFKVRDHPDAEKVSVLNIDMTEVVPVERRADTVVMYQAGDKKWIVIVESQNDPDKDKRDRWPYYISYLNTRHGCDVILLVICSHDNTAAWARQPIKIGLKDRPCQITTPLVLGPSNAPYITDVADARESIGATIVSAILHDDSEEVRETLKACEEALNTIDTKRAGELIGLIDAALAGTPAEKIWRSLMAMSTYPYKSHLEKQGEARGKAEGEATLVLRALEQRGVEVPEAARQRISTCTDTEQLEAWFDRALTATTIDDLFD